MNNAGECTTRYTAQKTTIHKVTIIVGVRDTAAEQPTHMRMYAGSSPTSVDNREELI